MAMRPISDRICSEHFPRVSREFIYLNSGTHSLCPQEILDFQNQCRDKYELNPTLGLMDVWGQLWQVQSSLADHFNGQPQDFWLRSNVTHPLNEFILNVPLPSGAEILTTDHEYGAVLNICRFRAERDGLQLRVLKMPDPLTMRKMSTDQWIEFFVSGISAKTKLFVGYHVYSGHGLVVPIAELSIALKRLNVVFAVDGAHGPGAQTLNFQELGNVDFYAGNLHKWWLGPKGTAFAWVNPRVQDRLQPLMAGWPTYESFPPFSQFAEGHRFAQRNMLLGCLDFSPFLAIAAGIKFWNEMGFSMISQERQNRLDHLVEKMGQAGFSPPIDFATPDLRGPVRAWQMSDRFLEISFRDLAQKILDQAKVQVAITVFGGRKYLRLSPHLHNTSEELEVAATRLAKFFL